MLFRTCAALSSLTIDPVYIECNDSLFSRESIFDEGFFTQLNLQAIRTDSNVIAVTRKEHHTKIPLTTHNSTQFITFALLVSPYSETRSLLVDETAMESGYINMTIESMLLLDSHVTRSPGRLHATRYKSRDIGVHIPSDFTSLSYIASAILSIGKESEVTINSYYPGNTVNESVLLNVYEQLGVRLEYNDTSHTIQITNAGSGHHGQQQISLKELPSAAANIMAGSSNTGREINFSGVSGMNNHKCQRAFVIRENIKSMGGYASLLFSDIGMFDRIQIAGNGPMTGGVELSSYKDHRICAANLIASLGSKERSIVLDIQKLDDGFPQYIQTLRVLGAEISLSESTDNNH